MTNQIKKIVANYVNTLGLPAVVEGTWTVDGLKLSDKITVPEELVHVPSWMETLDTAPADGDTVYAIKNLGGQSFFVLDVVKNER